MLKRFNRWYDALSEPWRFLFFLFIMMGWVPIVQIAEPGTALFNFGVTWMLCTCVIAFSRL